MLEENPAYLKDQLITYLGNKRSLLSFIEESIICIKKDLKKNKIKFADVFSGSGIVSRLAKSHSNCIFSNDLELYSKIINKCYLANTNDNLNKDIDFYFDKLNSINELKSGFISELYSPKDENNITKDDRVFFTKKNAAFIDTIIPAIDDIIPKDLRHFFIAPLLSEISIHSNTSGVFKGFYKDEFGIGQFGGSGKHALSRITSHIEVKKPIFSYFNCEFYVSQEDAKVFAKNLPKIDLAYLDPPYNQHPYGSNYFMLNLVCNYNKRPLEISKVSGIPKDWNRSIYNKKKKVSEAFFELLNLLNTKYLLISFNNEGFINKDDFLLNLSKIGKVTLKEQRYNTFRGSRNLGSRNIHVTEWLFLIKKM